MVETPRTLSRRAVLASVATFGSVGFAGGAVTRGAFSDSGSDSGSWTAGTWASEARVVYVASELTTARHETGTTTYGVTDAGVTGPVTKRFGSSYAIPYVTSSEALKLVDDTGSVQTLETGATPPKTSKSIVAAGAWNGSGDTVFYADGSNIYHVAPGDTSSTLVLSTGNGAAAILGVVDIDEDGTDELTYVDGSAVARYLKPNDTTEYKIGGFGSNNQYGVGAPMSTDSGPRLPVIGGSGQVALMAEDGTKTELTGGSAAKKTAVAGHDVDGDGTNEVTFIDTNGVLMYADDLTGKSTAKEFHDGAGNTITTADPDIGVL